MGGGGKGGSTTVQKMEIPPEVLARYNAVNARAETVAQRPYQAYSQDPNAFVAPLTATQQAGIQNTNMMAGAAQPFYGVGAALTGFGAQSVQPGALNVGQYYNPFTQAVAAPTLAALQQQQAVERSSLMNPQTARSFGGDRAGIVGANLARQQDLATAQAMAPIYQKAFADALGTAQQQQQLGLSASQADMNRLLQAGAQYGQLGTGAQQAGLAGAQAQLAAGQAEQQTQQAGLQALYNQFQQQQAYPFQVAQFLANIAMGTGALSGNTTTSTTTGGGGFFSDERLKENIQKVGETNDGQNIYRYNYKGDPRTQIGLLAQEVAQEHPEAVGEQNGYLTVDYRDATKDAARDHKRDGGSEMGTDIYDIDAPSAMLSGPMVSGLGAAVPAFAGAQGLPIQAGAINPASQGLLAPQATGYSPGTIEGAQAQLASLKGGKPAWSGEGYQDWKVKQLEDFLAGAQSQGGLVSGPGAFSRGGYAEAGYVNPALVYYSPVAAKGGLGGGAGPYGAALTPAQVQALKAPEIVKPQQQKSGLAQAAETGAALTTVGKGLSGGSDYLFGYDNERTGARERGLIEKARDYYRALGQPEQGPPMPMYAGGVAREGYSLQGGTPYRAAPYASAEKEDDPLGSALTAPLQKFEMMTTRNPSPKQPQGPSPAAQIGQAAGLTKAGKGLYDWGAGKLAGDATGAAGQLVNVGSATSTGIVPAAETGFLGSLFGGGGAGAVGAGEALAGTAAAAEGAGLLGTLGAGAAAVGEGIMTALPFLAFLSDERMKHNIQQVGRLNDGQPVYRFKYDGDDKTRMGLMAQDVERSHPEAVGGLGGMKMVDYKRATQVAAGLGQRQAFQTPGLVQPVDEEGNPVPFPQPVPGREQVAPEEGSTRSHREVFAPEPTPAPVPPADIPAKPRMASGLGDAPPRPEPSFFDQGLGKTIKDVGTSESFLIPALAGIGSMLASRNPTLGGAIGEGLVGGTTAYTTLQKQAADMLKQRHDMAKDLFSNPIEGPDGQLYWRHNPSGQMVDVNEYQRLRSEFMAGRSAAPYSAQPSKGAPSPTDLAKDTITQPPPKLEPRAGAPAANAPAEKPAAPLTTEQLAASVGTDAEGKPLLDKAQIKNNMLKPEIWSSAPEDRNPYAMRQQALKLQQDAAALRAKAQRIAQTMPENTKEAERLTAQAAQIDANRKELLDRSENILNEAADLVVERNKAISGARTKQEIGRTEIPNIEPMKMPEGKSQAELETDPEHIANRIAYNTAAYEDLIKRGSTDAAKKYYEAAEADRKRLNDLVNIVQTTRAGTQFSYSPNAQPFVPTKPEPMPADYKAEINPNTGIIQRKPITQFVGYPETGGHSPDPELTGKKVIIRNPEGDKKVISSMEKSAKLEAEMANAAEKSADGIATILKFSTAAKVLEAKGFNMTKAELANLANGLGMEALANQIMSAKDQVAAFNAMKTNVDQAISQVTNAFERPTQAEFLISEKRATPSIDMPVGSAHSLATTRLAGLLWQGAIKADWEREKRLNGTTNFAAWSDAWQKAHPKAMFEDMADRALGNFKGQDLPKQNRFAEGVVYVMPKTIKPNSIAAKIQDEYQIRPGDLFVMRNVNHAAGDIGEPTRVSPEQAYKVHLQAPALTYGAQ